MKFPAYSKSLTIVCCLLVALLSSLPVTVQAGSVLFFNSGYDHPRNHDRHRYGQRQHNYRRQDRALNFYRGNHRNRGSYIDYNRNNRRNDAYCPDNSYSGYRDRGSYQRPRGLGFFYYGKQR